MRHKINLNNYVYVKLTEKGFRVHEVKEKEYYNRDDYRPPEVDENGYSKFQLWDFMNIFGDHTWMGAPPCFEMAVEIEDVI